MHQRKPMKVFICWIATVCLLSCKPSPEAKENSSSLFNGTDLTGWHVDVPDMDTANSTARNPFIVRNGMLVSLGKPNGHLITDSVFQNYKLEVEYRFAGA